MAKSVLARQIECRAKGRPSRVQGRGWGGGPPWLSVSLAPGQQFLHKQYQRWGQVHLQVLQQVVSRDWQQAVAEMTSGIGGVCLSPGKGREPRAWKALGTLTRGGEVET